MSELVLVELKVGTGQVADHVTEGEVIECLPQFCHPPLDRLG